MNPFEKHFRTLQDALDAHEKEHPHWRIEVLVSLMKWGFKSLKHYIEDVRDSEITWDNPFVELHFPVDWDWSSTLEGDAVQSGLIVGKLTKQNTANKKQAVKTLTEIVVHQLNILTLGDATNGVWYEKRNDYYTPVLPVPLNEELEGIKSKKARQAAFEQMVRPFSIGGAYVDFDETEFESGEPVSKKAAAQLAKLHEQMDIPHIGFKGDVNGRKIEMSLVFQIHPLLADYDSKKAYFPVTVGLGFLDGPINWPRKDRQELWAGLLGEIDKVTDQLIPKAQSEDSVILSVNSQIKVPASAWRPQNRSATIKAITDHLALSGEVEQFNVQSTKAVSAGLCPVCHWIHDTAFTAIQIGGDEAILLRGVLPEIVRLVHRAHENGLSALSTKDDELLKTCGGYGNPCKAFDDLKRSKEYKRLFDTSRRGFIALRGAAGRNRNQSEASPE